VSALRVITFTTDFGTGDHYVGTMKGVVLGICPIATLVDVCHEVHSYNILEGALTVAQAYPYFPAGTIHVVVVDPGVGGARRPIIAETRQHTFVSPDNGVLSFVYQHECEVTVRHVANDRYFLHPVSNTFHGRDIFAPVAAHIAAGVPLDNFGPQIEDYVRLNIATPKLVAKGTLQGAVLKVDKFGNVVTNITAGDLSETLGAGASFRVRIAGTIISDIRTSYAGAPTGQLFAVFGSMGYLEIASNQSSAAEQLQVKPNLPVEITAE
jgi:S-adenosylmethionine hydrolase